MAMALRRHKDEDWDGTERRAPAAVLVVNEDSDAGRLLARHMERSGFRACTTDDHLSTLQQLTEAVPRCVVIDLTDSNVGSFLRTLDVIRGHQDPRIADSRVVVSATDTKHRWLSFRSGADEYLVRPYRAEELTEVVSEALSRPQEERLRRRLREHRPLTLDDADADAG
jgi:DNA-binding response OmpR family regulator